MEYICKLFSIRFHCVAMSLPTIIPTDMNMLTLFFLLLVVVPLNNSTSVLTMSTGKITPFLNRSIDQLPYLFHHHLKFHKCPCPINSPLSYSLVAGCMIPQYPDVYQAWVSLLAWSESWSLSCKSLCSLGQSPRLRTPLISQDSSYIWAMMPDDDPFDPRLDNVVNGNEVSSQALMLTMTRMRESLQVRN